LNKESAKRLIDYFETLKSSNQKIRNSAQTRLTFDFTPEIQTSK